MFTGDDGQTHIEATDLTSHPELTEAQPSSSITATIPLA